MNYLWICLIILSLSSLPSFADDSTTEETTDSTTETLENSTTEPLQNEEKITAEDAVATESKDQVKPKRNKWDFSDHHEDKKSDKAKRKTTKDAQKTKQSTFTSPKTLKDSNKTWRSPASGKPRQSTYAK